MTKKMIEVSQEADELRTLAEPKYNERVAVCLDAYAASMDKLHRDIADDFRRGATAVRTLSKLPETTASLRKRVEALEKGLEPFAEEAKRRGLVEALDRYSFANTGLSNGNLRNACSLLSERTDK